MKIIPYTSHHLDHIVRLSLAAWSPVFDSLQEVMDEGVFGFFHPKGWHKTQEQAVRDTCTNEAIKTWVAVEAETVAGFVSVKLDPESKLGEIYMVAVDPKFQRRGISKQLGEFALDYMRQEGMEVAMVDTGGDPGHGPARRSYEKLGFDRLPIARYFKKL